MSTIIFGMNLVFVGAVLIWGVLSMIKIHIDYKRRCKLLDEWYQEEIEWLKEQKQRVYLHGNDYCSYGERAVSDE